MNKYRNLFRFILIALILVSFAGLAWAKTATTNNGNKIWDSKDHNVGDVLMPITNFGQFGQNPATGRAGTEWPQGTGEFYIYGAGIWIGYIDKTTPTLDNNGDEIYPYTARVTVGYDPNNGNSEFVPGDQGTQADADDPANMVYMSNDASTSWPAAAGEAFSIQDSWSVFDDRLKSEHDAGDMPMGVQVNQHSYAWNYESNKDFVFVSWKIKNVGYDKNEDGSLEAAEMMDLDSLYLSITADPDLGLAENDMMGFDEVRNMSYVYNNNNEPEGGWVNDPGYCGFVFLKSPLVNPADPSEGEVGMSAFQIPTLETDPKTDWAKYARMTGVDNPLTEYDEAANWTQFEVDTAPQDKRSMQVTGPFTIPYGEETEIVTAVVFARTLDELKSKADAAISIFNNDWLLPKPPVAPQVELVELDGRIIVQWDDAAENYIDPYYWVASSEYVLASYMDNLTISGDYPTATIDASEPDGIVDIVNADGAYLYVWDQDIAGNKVANPNYNTDYKKTDFEGYRVYKSSTGQAGTFEMVAQHDLTSATPYNVDVQKLAGGDAELVYDADNTIGYIHAYGGSDLFTGEDYQIATKMVDDTLRLQVINLTKGVELDPSGGADHWYNHGDDPAAFEIFDNELWSVYDLGLPEDVPFDSCYIYVGGFLVQLFGDMESGDVFEIHTTASAAFGENNGIAHIYVDPDLTNGFKYYYSVTAYDFNVDPISLESGVMESRKLGIPKSMANGFEGGAEISGSSIANVNAEYEVVANVINPLDITGDTYTIEFTNRDAADNRTFFACNIKTETETKLALHAVDGTSSPLIDGIEFAVTAPDPSIEASYQVTDETAWDGALYFAAAYMTGGRNALMNGNDYTYELRFIDGPDPATWSQPALAYNEAAVVANACPFQTWAIDADGNEYQLHTLHYSFYGAGDGWQLDEYFMFLTPDEAGNKINEDFFANPAHGGAYAGFDEADPNSRFDWDYRIAFNLPGGSDGETGAWWTAGDVVRFTTGALVHPGDEVTISTVEARVYDDKVDLSQIKVVPNPYILYASWDAKPKTGDALTDKIPAHYIAFTHLPSECTIRVYTAAGDLVKTIEHDPDAPNTINYGVNSTDEISDANTDRGWEFWNLLTESGRKLASGVYIYHVDSPYGEKIGKFAVIQ